MKKPNDSNRKYNREDVLSLSDCTLCPRNCHVNRLRGERGFCGESGTLRAARAALYYTEEPVISGKRGSGTVFFSGCNLGCIYCQNRQISRPETGKEGGKAAVPERSPTLRTGIPERSSVPQATPSLQNTGPVSASSPGDAFSPRITEISPERLAEIFLSLEAQGAHNINLVTPEHFVPLLIPPLRHAKDEGLSIPVVYNTGSYERAEAIKALEGLVDVWLPDLKYVSPALSALHTGAADYFQYASAAIAEMVRQCPEPVFSDGSHSLDCPDDADDPVMVRGVLVRHLALPGCAEDSRAVLRFLHETYGDRIFISIMNQYTPMPQVQNLKPLLRNTATADSIPDTHAAGATNRLPDPFADRLPDPFANLRRCLREEEYDALVDYAVDLGITNGFIQESGTVSPSYIPVFDGTGII